MSILGALTGSTGSGGSQNSSRSISSSFTNGSAATAYSNVQASQANTSALDAWNKAAQYNAEQAEIQRRWQERMANTTYQRTMEDMKKAGINPILAAGMGLSADSVGSGATASISTPTTYMANSYADSQSASESYSKGRSWQNSESGLATGLQLLGNAIAGAIGKLNSSQAININMEGLKNLFSTDHKENQKGTNQISNYYDTGHTDKTGKANPFKKGTNAYTLWEMQHNFQKLVQ